jgi:ABC-2 type transport system ATP-binding protein
MNTSSGAQELTTTHQYAIETRNLTKTYKAKTARFDQGFSIFKRRENRTVKAIDQLNLQIRKGELFGLLGPNGAGKTTLVKILCTLLPPDNGTATVNGFDVREQSMDVKRSIGTLFSIGERGFFWRLTGYRNLEFFAAIFNVPRHGRGERIMDVLDLLGLKDKAHEHFQKYSGGMKRKLSLARTLLADPPILLLDEPTTGLDVISSRNIRDFIRNDLTRKAGKTVLYTTHYVEEAAQICDRIGVLNKGKLIALDTPNALKEMARKGEIVEFVVENISDNQVNVLRRMGGVDVVTAEVLGNRVGKTRLRMRLENPDLLPKILNYFFEAGIRLVNFKREDATLEDAFVKLTSRGAAE